MLNAADGEPRGGTMTPVKYVLIPAEDSSEPKELLFSGGSDEEFRGLITRHFRQQLLSDEQRNEMAKHLAQKVHADKKHGVGGATPPAITEQQSELISDYLEQTSFEIVPIVMPVRGNKFIGTSLYIDDSGRFKDLPLNSRASKIAQKDIRGDAFLLSNHDDPALDEWNRVDCTITTYNELFINPPATTYDTADRAQMTSLTMQRESETKRISQEDVVEANRAKKDGNAFFAQGDLNAAVQAYSKCVDLTEGRRDLLHNEKQATDLRIAALLNRSLCQHRLGRNDEAARDAQAALQLNNSSAKAYHHLTVALCASRDFGAATTSLQAYESLGGDSADVARLRQTIIEGKKKFIREQKQKYSKLFS